MKRIVFVDDEPNVLAGLRNLLHKQRGAWHMIFANSAQDALAALDMAPVDVIITDMRMPGMDGATLLQKTKEKHPSVARIILSGHAEEDAIARALPVAHQFLNKPCDADALRTVIERACELRTLLANERIQKAVGGLSKLPSVPETYWELIRVAVSSRVSVRDVSQIVERDPAMSAKVLQMVNSAYFGLAQRITSVQQAVAYLGMDVFKGLALSAHIFSAMEEGARVRGFSLDALQETSLITAKVARRLLVGQESAEVAFTAALVHDVGQIVLALVAPNEFAEALALSKKTGRPIYQTEKEVCGVTHAETGAYLLGVWGLPFPIVEAVAYHHNPRFVSHARFDLICAIHVADALVDIMRSDPREREADPWGKLDRTLLEKLDLMPELSRWRAIAREECCPKWLRHEEKCKD